MQYETIFGLTFVNFFSISLSVCVFVCVCITNWAAAHFALLFARFPFDTFRYHLKHFHLRSEYEKGESLKEMFSFLAFAFAFVFCFFALVFFLFVKHLNT